MGDEQFVATLSSTTVTTRQHVFTNHCRKNEWLKLLHMVSKCGDVYCGKRKSGDETDAATQNGWRRISWLNLGFLIQLLLMLGQFFFVSLLLMMFGMRFLKPILLARMLHKCMNSDVELMRHANMVSLWLITMVLFNLFGRNWTTFV